MKMTDRMLRNERDFTTALPLFVGVRLRYCRLVYSVRQRRGRRRQGAF
jgi:hypothetical protein